MASAQVGNAGTAQIDTDALTREPSAQEKAAAAEKAAKDRAILEEKGLLPGQQTQPGTLQIDPVAAGWEEDPNKWKDMTRQAVHGYASAKFGYNPYMTKTGPEMQGMNFNPYYQSARNTAQSQAASGLGQTMGMSASDRMRSFSDFNRAKITGQLGNTQKIDQAQSQNLTDVGRFNAGRAFDVNQANVNAFNTASKYKADAGLRRDQNLYAGALAERNLGRQLQVAGSLSKGGAGNSSSLWDIDKLLGGIN